MNGATDTDIDTAADVAVSVRAVDKTYQLAQPVHALRDVSFDLPRGSYTAVMGPSGSGKSTLMNLIGCLDTPTAGTIVVDERDVTALSGVDLTQTEVFSVFTQRYLEIAGRQRLGVVHLDEEAVKR